MSWVATMEVTFVRAHQLKADGTLEVLIPKVIRQTMGITKGTKLAVYQDEDKIVYKPVPP